MSGEPHSRVDQSGHGRVTAIYHRVHANEGFEEAAQTLYRLVPQAQRIKPGAERVLYLDIDGHRNRNGAFDSDMFELQHHFILGFLLQFLTEVNMPLAAGVRRKDSIPQSEDMPETLTIQNPAEREG